jgi:ATP-dependent helicase/nuclease subunit A
LATSNLRLPFDDPDGSVEARIDARDRAGRERAVDPRFNVALEASAGTGKTRVLVDRYINLLRVGVNPSNVLAITFTRKAAAEMRERIVSTLRAAADRGEISTARWRELRDRMEDIAISTIDAFCLALLREFPLEADVDPGFTMADETEVPRLVDEALDRTLRICRALAREDEDVALAFAQLSERRVRAALTLLLNRRTSAPDVLRRFLASGPGDLTVQRACRHAAGELCDALSLPSGGLERFLDTGPLEAGFELLARDLRRLDAYCRDEVRLDPAAVQAAFTRVREHFLTQEGQPRKQLVYAKADFASERDWKQHRELVVGHGESVVRMLNAYRRDLNVIVSRGVWRMFGIAESEYGRTLEAHAVLDFSEVLRRALHLLRQREEFSQSRFRLESRFQHILVDEFQDTSRAQWELVSRLIESWPEGEGASHAGPIPPTIFIVGDRKQSIYGFRDADVSVLEEARRYLQRLRPDGDVRRSISRSFRSRPALLAFVNDVCAEIDKESSRRDAFRYEEQDRFPVDVEATPDPSDALGLVAGDTPEACAELTAEEIERLVSCATVRDRDRGIARPARPGDIAILFRTRESHREFEAALEKRGLPAYVYKGLGFFDADEIKDTLSLLWYLAEPLSNLRAAAWLRSRFVGLSDEALRLLAPRLADAISSPDRPAAFAALDAHDAQALQHARTRAVRWRGLVDRLPPAELLDLILTESAYGAELRGPRLQQARENLKKIRALIRRIQNRGYVTIGRIAAHLDRLSTGDEANAVVDAVDAVNLMTVHAAKGLEFPIVFVVNLAKGTGNRRDPVRISDGGGEPAPASVSVGDFQSETDEDAAAKEREEMKRLLYVALTRARDRLYLGSVLKEGTLQPGRGSFAEVLPLSLAALLGEAATSAADEIVWRPGPGRAHTFARVRPGSDRGQTGVRTGSERGQNGVRPQRQDDSRFEDFAHLTDTAIPRRSVAATLDNMHDTETFPDGRGSDRLVGSLVHRLLNRLGPDSQLDRTAVAALAATLLKPDELGDPGSLEWIMARAADAFLAVCIRADVRARWTAGERLHEVPFSMRMGEGILRGTIDCLIRTPEGTVVVLEFKTGQPRPEHRKQLELYRHAAALMFPDTAIESLLVYTDEVVPVG